MPKKDNKVKVLSPLYVGGKMNGPVGGPTGGITPPDPLGWKKK